jgi:hypothetical protein
MNTYIVIHDAADDIEWMVLRTTDWTVAAKCGTEALASQVAVALNESE